MLILGKDNRYNPLEKTQEHQEGKIDLFSGADVTLRRRSEVVRQKTKSREQPTLR